MPKYTYIVKDPSGKTITDTVEAGTHDALMNRLQAEGYFIVSISEVYTSKKKSGPAVVTSHARQPKKAKKFSHTKVKLEDLLTFCRQLGTMLQSGVTLIRSLDILGPNVDSKQLAVILEQVKADVSQGHSLSKALSRFPKVFGQFIVSLVEVGEAGGTMPEVLDKLADYLEQQAAFRSTIISAMIYPIILVVMSIAAVMVFALFIGPRFEEIFVTLNAKLPVITQILLNVFSFIQTKFWLLTLAVIVLFLIVRAYVRTEQGRLQFERAVFNIPSVGTVYKQILTERFTSQMAMLIESGVPILYALEISQRLIGCRTAAIILGDVRSGVSRGELLVTTLEKSSFFPPMAVQMIMVGEETGELAQMLKHVAEFYAKNVERFMKRLSVIVEPVMIIFMAGIIGTLVVAMFFPLFTVATG